MRTAVTYTKTADVVVFDDDPDDPQETAGDQFAELEWSACPFDPLGHLFKTSCGETKCMKCGEVSWS